MVQRQEFKICEGDKLFFEKCNQKKIIEIFKGKYIMP